MSSDTIVRIPIDDILVDKYNVRKNEIDKGLEDLAASIKANGLLQPITVYRDTEKSEQKNKNMYVILAGQRRLNAHHFLNKNNPNKGFDRIRCVVIDEPQDEYKKISLSLAENITIVPMQNTDLVKAVADLFARYGDYEIVQKEFGLTKFMVDKYVKLSRLPIQLQTAINEGAISSRPQVAVNAAIRAISALNWVKGEPVEDVIELAKEYAKGEIDNIALTKAAKMGGSISDIKKSARNRPNEKLDLKLDIDLAENLTKVSDASGMTRQSKAISYIQKGVEKELLDEDQ